MIAAKVWACCFIMWEIKLRLKQVVALDLGRSKLSLFLFLLRFESIFMGEKKSNTFSPEAEHGGDKSTLPSQVQHAGRH